MTTEVQGVLFYTQEDIDAKVAELKFDNQRELALLTDNISNGIVDTLKGEVREGNMEKDYANALYREFCNNVGLVLKEINNAYSVTVSYEGTELAVFTDIEADSDDDAIEFVKDNMDISDIEVTLTLEFEGSTQYGSVSLSPYELELDFDYEAEEQ